MNWVKNNQGTICADFYTGARDQLHQHDGNNVVSEMKRTILPSSITGSDRYMHQQYLDSIALWQRFGSADGFLTYTFNANCREIKEQLSPGETALDRPDLVARVFKLKKDQLIRDLSSEHIFGKMLARTHTIEYQKRYVLYYTLQHFIMQTST